MNVKIKFFINSIIKEIKIKILNQNRQAIFSFSLFLLSFTIIQFSSPFFDEIQPDSYGYMYPTQNRQTLYYLLITLLNKIGISIILFQKIFLSFSIVLLVFFIGRKTSLLLGILSYILIILNTYYTSYSNTILPESILFSLLNLAVVYLFEEKRGGLIIFALICGTIASLKPIGILLSTILFILFFIKNKINYKVFIFIIFLAIPNLLENFFFYSQYKERTTIFKQIVVGKLVILSGKDSFIISNYSEELQPFLEKTKKEFRVVHNFLDDLDNPLLKAELLSDYEVVAQYQTFNLESIKNSEFEENIVFENTNNIFFEIIRNNFYDYLKLSLFHYVGNWSIGSKVRFLNANYKEVPLYQELVKSSGPINLPNHISLVLAQILFVLFLFFLTIHCLYILICFSKAIVKKSIFINSSIIFLIQSYLIITSFTNVSTPRYLMVVYPLIIMSNVNFINYFYSKKKEKKINKN